MSFFRVLLQLSLYFWSVPEVDDIFEDAVEDFREDLSQSLLA